MDNLKNFYLNNKNDIISVLALLIIFIICSFVYWGSWGSLFLDNGREAYLPQIMLQGKVIYKDIFAMYNPFAYQINAIIYAIFKADLNVLQMCGSVATFLILGGIYAVSRLFIKQFFSFVFCLFIMAQFIFFSLNCINYIIPYSYAMIYSLLFFIWFVFSSLLYFTTGYKRFLYTASLLMGLSLACRFEFIFCLIPFIIIMLYRKESIKTITANALIMIMPLILSWATVFLQGLTIEDFNNYLKFIQDLFNTQEQKTFSKEFAPLFSIKTVIEVVLTFILSLLFLLINSFIARIIINKKNIFLRILLSFILFFANFLVVREIAANRLLIFSWCCLTSMIIAFIGLKNNQKLLAVLSIYAILSCVRMNFVLINVMSYSIYFVLLPLLVNWIFFIQSENKLINKYDLKKSLAVFLVIFSFSITAFTTYTKKNFLYEINTQKGKIINYTFYTNVFEKAVKWVEENTHPMDEVLMLPEGPMINFITGRPSKNMYYHLIPNHIKALGEENVKNGLSSDPPEYIFINNLKQYMYGHTIMCDSFGNSICHYIKTNYKYITRLDSSKNSDVYFFIDIYKLKRPAK